MVLDDERCLWDDLATVCRGGVKGRYTVAGRVFVKEGCEKRRIYLHGCIRAA